MPDQQQGLLALLLLAGAAGLLLWMGRQPPPPPGTRFPTPTGPVDLDTIAAMHGNGARPGAGVARAVPFYQNEETWELVRDQDGFLQKIVVHRQAQVAK